MTKQPDTSTETQSRSRLSRLPRNLWAVSATSFLMDISSEMVINILPLFLANVLGVRTSIIGLIEGVAESTASLVKLFSGWFSDRLKRRKSLAVAGYALSAFSKPFFLIASSWGAVAVIRWVDRLGKGVRTAPRDALLADSITAEKRGFAFGLHRAADTAGALLGLLIALGVVWFSQKGQVELGLSTFHAVVLVSIFPAFAAVLVLALGAREVAVSGQSERPRFSLRALGKPFLVFMVIVAIFDLGNSSDAFLVLRAQERGLSVVGILGMLASFNLVYAVVSTPAGAMSDRIGRRTIIISGWLVYAAIYLGFALAQNGLQVWVLYVIYGLYYGLAYGTSKALVADLVGPQLRGTAYGTYNAVLGILDFPASLIAGILWQGMLGWQGWGPSAPFLFGAGMAFVAAILMWLWMPRYLPAPGDHSLAS